VFFFSVGSEDCFVWFFFLWVLRIVLYVFVYMSSGIVLCVFVYMSSGIVLCIFVYMSSEDYFVCFFLYGF
jgi:hypothetical protein